MGGGGGGRAGGGGATHRAARRPEFPGEHPSPQPSRAPAPRPRAAPSERRFRPAPPRHARPPRLGVSLLVGGALVGGSRGGAPWTASRTGRRARRSTVRALRARARCMSAPCAQLGARKKWRALRPPPPLLDVCTSCTDRASRPSAKRAPWRACCRARIGAICSLECLANMALQADMPRSQPAPPGSCSRLPTLATPLAHALRPVAFEISKILNTGLDRETVSIIIGLCEVRRVRAWRSAHLHALRRSDQPDR